MNKTLRLILPQWQGGVNPDYLFGAELLAFIAPPSGQDETVRIAVDQETSLPLPVENGVEGERALLWQLRETSVVVEARAPDRVIVFGGDCSVSQAPFDYLSGKYGKGLGIIWLDAHPDIATPQHSTHAHEMVLGSIMGRGAPSFAARMKHPIDARRVIYAGLIEGELRPMGAEASQLGIRMVGPQELKISSEALIAWIKDNGISHLAVHWDLDVVSPEDFRAILPGKPYLKKEDFPAAVGELTIREVVRIMNDVNRHAELVGLSIAEHMPWDAMNLSRALNDLPIFND